MVGHSVNILSINFITTNKLFDVRECSLMAVNIVEKDICIRDSQIHYDA